MSNKMHKILLIILCVGLLLPLAAFSPKQQDFDSIYQYKLYRSWTAKEGNFSELPAKINSQYVKRTLNFKRSGEAPIIYIWDNFKIKEQREDLFSFIPFSSYETQIIIAGELLYRINCRHQIFARHYLQQMPVNIHYQGMRDMQALDALFAAYPHSRLPAAKFHPVFASDVLMQLIMQFENGEELIIIFDDISNYLTASIEMQRFEQNYNISDLPSDFTLKPDEEIFYEPVTTKPNPEQKTINRANTVPDTAAHTKRSETEPSAYEKKLISWIENNQDNNIGNEMINNKIPDISHFLQNEFKEHSLLIKNNHFNLKHVPFTGGLKADLYFDISENDGWDIRATDDVVIENKKVTIAGFEKLDLSDLENFDIEIIAPYLPQLLLSHRVMASQLAGFILQPDVAETTLVVDGAARHIYNLQSYRALLSLLGRFWKDRIIYYNISDFQLVNGYIEFKGYLAAENCTTGNYDLAEIRYRLDDDYTIVLAMVVIFPDQMPTQG